MKNSEVFLEEIEGFNDFDEKLGREIDLSYNPVKRMEEPKMGTIKEAAQAYEVDNQSP